MLARAARGAAAAVAGAVLVVLVPPTGVAFAAGMRDDGENPESMSVLHALAVFVGIPLAVFLLVVLAVYVPGSRRGPRYRPGLGWWAGPVWFGGPDDAEGALAAVPTDSTGLEGGGGASARW